jgi:hypothetical protein
MARPINPPHGDDVATLFLAATTLPQLFMVRRLVPRRRSFSCLRRLSPQKGYMIGPSTGARSSGAWPVASASSRAHFSSTVRSKTISHSARRKRTGLAWVHGRLLSFEPRTSGRDGRCRVRGYPANQAVAGRGRENARWASERKTQRFCCCNRLSESLSWRPRQPPDAQLTATPREEARRHDSPPLTPARVARGRWCCSAARRWRSGRDKSPRRSRLRTPPIFSLGCI